MLYGLATSDTRLDRNSVEGRGTSRSASFNGLSGRVLVIEDDVATRVRLADGLRTAGVVVHELTGHAVSLEPDWARFDLLIIDLFGPGIGGLEGCRRLRCASTIPIVILTARDSEADRVLGLEAGADGYISKPLVMAEALCRVGAILRRRELDLHRPGLARKVGDLLLDFAENRVVLRGRPVILTPTEFRLLSLLTQEPGRTFSACEILRTYGVATTSATKVRARRTSRTCAASSSSTQADRSAWSRSAASAMPSVRHPRRTRRKIRR